MAARLCVTRVTGLARAVPQVLSVATKEPGLMLSHCLPSLKNNPGELPSVVAGPARAIIRMETESQKGRGKWDEWLGVPLVWALGPWIQLSRHSLFTSTYMGSKTGTTCLTILVFTLKSKNLGVFSYPGHILGSSSCQEQMSGKTWFHPKLFLSLNYCLPLRSSVTLNIHF